MSSCLNDSQTASSNRAYFRTLASLWSVQDVTLQPFRSRDDALWQRLVQQEREVRNAELPESRYLSAHGCRTAPQRVAGRRALEADACTHGNGRHGPPSGV